MKFFKWKIETKIQRLDQKERVKFLTLKLVDELKKMNDYDYKADSLQLINIYDYTDLDKIELNYESTKDEYRYGKIYCTE